MNMETLTTSQAATWLQILEKCGHYDFYHLPQYHALAEEHGEGSACLFCHEQDGYTIALPLLLRPVSETAGLSGVGSDLVDATSVYGYAGPIVSHAQIPDQVTREFRASLERRLRERGVVTVFSRLHPTLPQEGILDGLGELCELSRTVSIDLTLPVEVQRAAFRKNHKEGINRLRRQGMTCVEDPDGRYLDDFVAIYHETMTRVGARAMFFYSREYIQKFKELLGERFHLFVCLQEEKPVCAGIFVECDGIVQYHLGGTITDALKQAPMKLLVDETRLWATRRGRRVYHVGGGATMRPDDPLLHFKLGFSHRSHAFRIWRWVVRPDIHQRLCRQSRQWQEENGLAPAVPGFFPEYRCPTMPALTPTPSPCPPRAALTATCE